ncbi:MAG TPA: DoxX family protein [Pyrinomonadaceae bacterium]|nr:DoxX family protein [Pyrinomonadaceae bacterium]
MANLDSFYAAWGPRLLSLLRIVSAFMLMAHGMQKVFGLLVPPPQPGAPPRPPFQFELMTWQGVGGVLELAGGLLLLLGLFTRPVAFILSGMMAVAYWKFHAWGNSMWPILNRGELAALYCFVFLYLSAAGGGPWSVDWCLRRRRGDALTDDAMR